MFDNDDGDTMPCTSCGKSAVGASGGFCRACKARIQPEKQRTHWADGATLKYIADMEAAVLKMRCCGNCRYYAMGGCHHAQQNGRPGYEACRAVKNPETGEVTEWLNWAFGGKPTSLF